MHIHINRIGVTRGVALNIFCLHISISKKSEGRRLLYNSASSIHSNCGHISFINLAIFAGYLVLSVVIYMVGSCFKSNDDVWDDDEFRLDASDDEANVDGKIFTGQNNLVTDGAKNKEDPMMTSSVVLHDNDLDF
eukprot:Awhi_evm1s11522